MAAVPLPIGRVRRPADLKGVDNGQLPPRLLRSIEPSGQMHRLAAAGWAFLRDRAMLEGIVLMQVGDYRSYARQEALFLDRMRKVPDAKREKQITRRWNGETWFLHSGAPVATPGSSNHGWGLAVDAAVRSRSGKPVHISTKPLKARRSGIAFLRAVAPDAGFTWELQEEPWHIVWCVGDAVPPAVVPYLGRRD